MVMINYSKLRTSLWENLMSEFYVSSAKVKWKLRKREILPLNQNNLSVYLSLAKFQLVS